MHKKRISIVLIVAILVATIAETGISSQTVLATEDNNSWQNIGTNEVAGYELRDIPMETESEDESESETMVETTPEVLTEESTTSDSTTHEPTTQAPTTQAPTTQAPTTQEPTTPAPTTKLKPWGKNSKGQFVNGNKKVINGATMKGIDVSKHNGKIDWKKVAASDVDYAIIRCGYGDNYTYQDDPRWKENALGCEKNNIPYGVYIYSYASNTKQALSEAKHVLRLIKGHTLNFPIYYDMEDEVTLKGLSNSDREKIANTFMDAIKAEGYEVGIYSNLNWWTNYLPKSLAASTPLKWLAQYNDNACTYSGVYQMWQCTSTGRVDGINGNVDLNFWFDKVRTTQYNIRNYGSISKPVQNKVTAPSRVTIKSLKKGKKRAVIKIKKVSKAYGYKIQYSTRRSFAAKVTRSRLTTKRTLTIKSLKSKKRYYFRVKAYRISNSKKKIYSKKWSKVKSVIIK